MSALSQHNEQVRYVVPAYRISEVEGTIQLEVELPGVAKDDIQVSVERDELILVGTLAESVISGDYLVRERRSGTFRKAFTIDERIDRDKIGAVHANGVMILTLHVKEAVKPRRIAISTK